MATLLKLSTALLVFGLAITSSAAEPRKHNLVVDLRLPERAPGIVTLVIEVHAADLKEPIKAQIRRGKEGVTDAIFIAPGKAREIHVAGLDEKGRVLYEGVSTANIAPEVPTSIVVAMSPREGGEPIAVSIATYSIKVEQTKGRKGAVILNASAYDANGNIAHFTPDDFNWGAHGPWPFDDQHVIPHGPVLTIPSGGQVQQLLPLCPFGTTNITICFHGICRPVKDCADPVVSISAGLHHTCALKASGALFCWGDNSDGQLGSQQIAGCGILSSAPFCTATPTRVVCPAGTPCTFNQVSAGERHTCAIDTNEKLLCWGSNSTHQLGVTSTTSSTNMPQFVTTMAVKVAAGDDFTCAITHNAGNRRQVKCWGENKLGQTGLPLTAPSFINNINNAIQIGDINPIPTPGVANLLESKFILAGSHHACLVTLDGWMQCWGSNSVQQVANTLPIVDAVIAGSPVATSNLFHCLTCTVTPVQVAGALFAGVGGSPLDVAGAGGNTTCASFTGGDTTCWGSHPVTLNSTFAVKSIDAGTDHVCAVTAVDTRCWGAGDWGQLGNGTSGNLITPFSVPTPVTVLTTSVFTQVSAGGTHTCAVTTGGTVSCWGRNSEGQLGTGAFGSQVTTPVASLL